MLGICNGFQILCEAGLLPGALLPNTALRFVCRQVELEVERTDTPFTRACEPVERCRSRPSTRPAATSRPRSRLAAGRAALRRRATTSTARRTTSPACCNEAGNVIGLMPHPEHAVDVLTRLGRRAEAVRVDGRARRRCPGRGQRGRGARRRAGRRARPDARRVRAGLREARPRAQRGRAGDVLAAVERALRLQALQEAAAHAAHRGAARSSWARARTPAPSTSATGGRSRSRSSRTTTRARSSRSRAPPPASAASCATSSRSARGRSRCWTRCASASPTRSARATCSTAPSPASATTATRSACRRSAARSTSRRPTRPTASSTPWPSAWPAASDMVRSAAAGVGNVLMLFGASTGRDGIGGASVLARPSSARTTSPSARRFRSATRSRRTS